ncbi:hypothetical protein FHG87_021192 [Trinorchestia longiramus]|nr:hypothetical protein FHG87_021192 [Trinorchestia longiramus]
MDVSLTRRRGVFRRKVTLALKHAEQAKDDQRPEDVDLHLSEVRRNLQLAKELDTEIVDNYLQKDPGNVDCDSWIVDSGATRHMCNKKSQFSSCSHLSSPVRVEIGDGRALNGIGVGDVRLRITLPNMQLNLMFLERSAYTKALLSRFGMDKANSVATPVHIDADLVTTSDEVEDCDKDLYQSAVGTLLY